MTPAERERIAEATRQVVAQAPPVPAKALAMLRRDRCPVGRIERTEQQAS